MPLRGESVGTAYIKLLVDGSDLPEEIRRELEKNTSKMDDAGSRDAKRYKKAWEQEMESHANSDKTLGESLAKALAKDDFVKEFFDKPAWQRTQKNMEARFGTLGTQAADQIKEKFIKSGSLDGLEQDVENVVSRINANVDKIIAEKTRATEEASRTAAKFEADLRRTLNDTDKMQVDAARVSHDAARTVETAWSRVKTSLLDLGRGWDALRPKMKRADRDAKEAATVFGRIGQSIDSISGKVGKVFGKGNRNNFLNFTGSFIGGTVSLLGVVPKILDNIAQFAKGFNAAFEESGKFFSSIKGGFTEMSKDADGAAQSATGLFSSLGSLIVAAPILALALLGVALVIGTVIDLFSGLAAAVIAVVSAIAFAIVGAIAPLVGLLAPLAVTLGIIVAGVVHAGLAAGSTGKTFSKLFQGLVDGFQHVGGVAERAFFGRLNPGFQNMHGFLAAIDPLARRIGAEMGNIANGAERWLATSPAAHDFLQTMDSLAPETLRRLSIAAGNVFDALSNVFVDLAPDVRRFLRWIDQVTQEFETFVQQNPREIKQFFREAADSTKAVAGFLGAAAGNLVRLLDAGRSTGDNIFTSLTKQVQKFTAFISPKGGKTVFDEQAGGIRQFAQSADGLPKTNPLENFFKNGKQVADDLGHIVVQLGILARELDKPGGAADALNTLSGAVDFFVRAVGDAKKIEPHLGILTTMIGGFGGIANEYWPSISKIAGAIAGFGNIDINPHLSAHLGGLGSAIKNLFSGLKGPGGGVTLAIHPPSLDWIPGTLGRIGGFFSGVSHRADGVNFGGLAHEAGHVADEVISDFGAIPVALGRLAGKFGIAAARWSSSILSEVSSLPGEILGYFSGLGKQIIEAIGSVIIHIGVSGPVSLLKKLGSDIVPHHATGGIFSDPHLAAISEKGAEAVVPLTGPLSNVDPSVRWLSAIARGMSPSSGASVQTQPGKVINVEQHIMTATTDPVGAANEWLSHLAAVG